MNQPRFNSCDDILNHWAHYHQSIKTSSNSRFEDTPLFISYFSSEFPSIYSTITNFSIVYVEDDPIVAAISVPEKGAPILYLNKHFTRWLLHSVLKTSGPQICFQTLAGILWHEAFHYLLRHFRVNKYGYNHELLNCAMDIVIDKFIHQHIESWRNWELYLKEVNSALDEKNLSVIEYPRFSLSQTPVKGEKWVLNFSDTEIYFYLSIAQTIPPPSTIDDPPFDTSEEPGQEEKDEEGTDNIDDKGNIERFYDEILSDLSEKAKTRIDENRSRPVPQGNSTADQVIAKIASERNHSIVNLLKKYINKISSLQKTDTWKKCSRKLPGLRAET